MVADNIREVAYSVTKHEGGHNSLPGKEDCLKKGIYRWQESTGFINPFKHLLTCCFKGQENAMYDAYWQKSNPCPLQHSSVSARGNPVSSFQ
jgi:hypothetical protein